jgi:hypothetical protein
VHNTGRAPWKCRAVENEENQNQVSLRFPPPVEIAARFPHSHRAGDCCLSNQKTNPKTQERSPAERAPELHPSGSS